MISNHTMSKASHDLETLLVLPIIDICTITIRFNTKRENCKKLTALKCLVTFIFPNDTTKTPNYNILMVSKIKFNREINRTPFYRIRTTSERKPASNPSR